MSESPVYLIARILSISSSAFLSGFAFSASYYGLPALGLAPIGLRVRQWQVIYDLGKLVSPTVSVASGILWGISAWIARDSEDWKFYAVGGLLTFGILLWTVGVMMPANHDLMRRAKMAKDGIEDAKFEKEAEESLAKWEWMNYVRAVLPMAATWIGLFAALK